MIQILRYSEKALHHFFYKFLLRIKRALFARLRIRALIERVQSLAVFIDQTEILYGLPELMGKRVLVLAPHPDDETCSCGGTIRLLTKKGVPVDVIVFSQGERGIPFGTPSSQEVLRKTAVRRFNELEAATKRLGISRLIRKTLPDGFLYRHVNKMRLLIEHELQTHDYGIVFCPWLYDGHSDHEFTAVALESALESYDKDVSIWFYESWRPLYTNRIVVIDDAMQVKRDAILEYQSQLECQDYLSRFETLSRFRATFGRCGKYAEAFLQLDKAAVLEIATQIRPHKLSILSPQDSLEKAVSIPRLRAGQIRSHRKVRLRKHRQLP